MKFILACYKDILWVGDWDHRELTHTIEHEGFFEEDNVTTHKFNSYKHGEGVRETTDYTYK